MTIVDLLAVGCGPANLSLMALSSGCNGDVRCIEKKPEFSWHPGQMMPGTRMQSEFYRDLVTPVDPTSVYSFLSYLLSHGRLVSFFNSGIVLPTREEFTDYMSWVAGQLPAIGFSQVVTDIDFDSDASCFVASVTTEARSFDVRSRHLVLGTGATPINRLALKESKRTIAVGDAYPQLDGWSGSSVAVIGGGQSAAEIVQYLIDTGIARPNKVDWWIRDVVPQALDTSHFVRDYYSRQYFDARSRFTSDSQAALVDIERPAERGISPALLEALYEIFYDVRCGRRNIDAQIFTATQVTSIEDFDSCVEVAGRRWLDGEHVTASYDYVVMCTGFEDPTIEILQPLVDRGILASQPATNSDLSLASKLGTTNKMFVQAGAVRTHGISQTALASMAERNAVILESVGLIGSSDEAEATWGEYPTGV